MAGAIYLIGGGEIKSAETHEIDKDIKSLASAGSTFVFLGFASQDNGEYADAIKAAFSDTFEVLVATERKGRDYAINALESAAVVYLGGGDAGLLMQQVAKWNLLEPLVAALERGACFVGMSAGAQALSSWYINEEGGAFEFKKGWGIAPVCVQVHAHRDSFDRARSLWDASGDARVYPLVSISERTAWRIDSHGERQVGPGAVWRVDGSES